MNFIGFVFHLSILWGFTAQIAKAEYRVFNLVITKKGATPEEPALTRTLASTLDPLQYKYYYPVRPDETVSYTETWMCKGRTDQQDFCPNPKLSSDPANTPTE